MSGLYFQIGADFDKLKQLKREIDDLKSKLLGMDRSADPRAFEALERRIRSLQTEYSNLGRQLSRYVADQNAANKATQDTASGLGTMHNMLLKIGGTTAIIGLGKQVIDVRNQFQQLEIAFGTMLKSQDKAAALMKDLTQFAAETPFGLQSAASGAKQLLAYGSTADTVIKELTMIGDVAAGTGQQIGDLVYLYGTLRTQGRAYLMDIRQFAGRGIPIYDELAKVLNVSKDKVNDFVSAGKVGFKEVEQAFKNMTSQGGLYGGLMEQQSAAIGGRIEALKDNIDSIFNTIGKDSEGIIYKSIDGLNSLVENYQAVGEVLVALIATYGLYRTALILNAATEALAPTALARIAQSYNGLLSVMDKVKKSQIVATLTNPYLIASVAIVALSYSVYKLATATSVQEQAQESLNKVMDQASKKKDELSGKTNDLVGVVNSETKTIFDQISAYKQLQGLYPNLLKNMDIQTFKTLGATEQQKLLNTAINELDFTNQEAKLIELNTLYDKFISAQRSNTGGFEIGSVADEISKALDFSFWDKYSKNANETFEILKQTIAGLEKEKKQRQDNLKEAELQAKPEAERNKLLQDQLQVLKDQEASILESILKTGEYKRNIDGTISPISDVEKKFNSINELLDNWNKNPFAIKNAFASADPVLNELLTKMRLLNEEKQKLTGQLASAVVPIINKSTLEKQVKDFKELEESLSPDKLKKLRAGESILPSLVNTSPEEFNKLKQLENNYKELGETAKKAKKDLKVYEDPDKASKAAETANNKAETAAEKARKAAQKTVDDQLKLNNDKSKALLDARNVQLENDQKLLDLQEEGFDKQQKQIELNHQKELLSIEKRTQELIEKKQYEERKQWDLNNPNGSKTPFTPTTTGASSLSWDEQTEIIRQTEIANKAREKGTDDILKSILKKYQDYNTQRSEVNKQFDAEEKRLRAENTAEANAALAVLLKKRKEALKSISESEANETKKSSDLFIRLFTDSSQQSIEQIRKVIVETQALQKYLSETKEEDMTVEKFGFSPEQLKEFKGNAEILKAILDGLIGKKKDLAGLSEFDSFILGVKDGIAKIQKGGTKNIGQGITDIGAAATAMMPSIEKFGQDLGSIFGSDTADDISVITDLLGATVEVGTGVGKIMSGDIVGGIKDTVSGIAKVFNMANAANQRHREALKLIEAAAKAQEHAYQIALRMQSLAYEQGNTIFGDDPYGKAINGAIEYKNALIELDKSLKGDGKLNRKSIFEIPKKSDIAALENLQIVTGHKKTGLFGLGKGKDTYSGILEVDRYKDLIKENGEFNIELAKTVIATEKMSEENKTALQSMIDNAESVKEAYAVMKDYLTNIFGDLGDTMTGALVNSFLKGEDAAKAFYESASSMVQNLVKDIINAAVIAPIIKKATEESMAIMEDTSLTDEQRMEKLMLVVDDILNKGLEAQDQAKGLYDYSNEKWKEITGKELFKNDSTSQSSTSGGFKTMSQDMGGELNGRFTALQMSGVNIEANTLTISADLKLLLGQTLTISDSVKQSLAILDESRTIQINSYYELKNISKNTNELYQMNERLGNIEKNTKGLTSR